ncbi:MAG: phage head closure protein [Flavobacteriaceae bacterium]
MDKVGKLNKIINFRIASTAKDAYGQEVQTWATGNNVFANVDFKKIGSGESLEADRFTPINQTVFTMRYREDFNEDDRILFKSEEYEIDKIIPIDNFCYLEVYAFKIGI